jgi:hypothetical protein
MTNKAEFDESVPKELPAQVQAESGDLDEARPEDLALEQIELAEEVDTASVPVMTPPGVVEEVSNSTGITTWKNSRKITALWSINQNRNSWAHIMGIGWKKLSNKCDSGSIALTVLASSAKLTQTPVNYREEADKMIHEMYVW